jgi:hypothetical protein
VTSIADLARRLSRKVEAGRAIRLTHEDLQLLVKTGAYGAVQTAATKELRDRCLQRDAASPSTSAGTSGSTVAPIAPTSRSSGTTTSESANEALAQARAMTGRPG